MIKWIIIILIGLVVLGYLGFDIRKAIDAPATRTNLEYAKEATIYVWNTFLSKPAKYLWNEIFIKYVWNPAIGSLNKKVGSTNFNLSTSTLPVSQKK